MLSLRPMSGYDIKCVIEQSISNFWSESYGQIYPVLRRLEAERLVTRTVARRKGKRERHVYALTAAGREALVRWLALPAEHQVGRVEALLKLFFGWQVNVRENIRHVERFRALQLGLLAKYAAIERHLCEKAPREPALPFWLLTLRYGHKESRALIEWCDESLAALRAMSRTAKRPHARMRAS